MDKEQIIKKLQELGITTVNAYPKSTFPYDGDIVVALYKRELGDDFYFYNKFDKKIYHLPKLVDGVNEYPMDNRTNKFLVPLHKCKVVWEDKEYVELPDEHYNTMTLRQYACIHLRVPETNLPWLNELIKESSKSRSVID